MTAASFDCKPGDVSLLPSGHDAWVVGEEPAVVVDFQGMIDYANRFELDPILDHYTSFGPLVWDLRVTCSTAHPNRSAFESALAADYLNDLKQVEKQFGPKGKAAFEQNLDARAAQTAASFIAVGKYRRVLVNEWYFMRYPWSESVRVLAHELTHTAQSELVDGRFTAADRWLVEGFADWVSYKFLDSVNVDRLLQKPRAQHRSDCQCKAVPDFSFASTAGVRTGLANLEPNSRTWSDL